MPRQVLNTLDFNNIGRIVNLPNPVSAQDPATKAYVDSSIEALQWKDNVRVATTSNISLASPGTTLDGITMSVNDRVLVMGQTTTSQNGIYIWNGAAVAMTRASDASTADELENAITTVDEGTSAGATFRQQSLNFTLDSGAVTFASFGTTAPGATNSTAGIIEIATQAEVDSGSAANLAVTPQTLAGWAGRLRKFTADIGDGSATQYTVTHNLNTRDVHVATYRNSGSYDEVIVDQERTTVNTVTIRFGSAPTSNAFRVVVIG